MAETAPTAPWASASPSAATPDPDAVLNTNLPDFSGNPFAAGLIGPASQMASTVGPGEFPEGMNPSDMLSGSMETMTGVLQQGLQAGTGLIGSFAGAAAQALGQFAAMAGQSLTSMATRSGQMGENVGQASESTTRATTLISAYLQQFQHISELLTPLLWVPGVAGALAEEASQTTAKVSEATAQLEGELGAHAATMAGPMSTDISQPATPSSGSTQPAMSALQSGISSGTSSLQGVGQGITQAMSSVGSSVGQVPQALTGLLSGGGSSGGGSASSTGAYGMTNALANPFTGNGHASSTAGGTGSGYGSASHAGLSKMLLDPRTMGKGAQLFLPDGSTSQAPNAVAAEAVRKALSQVGVPYEWGGTHPGVGLDCSGLTQWAYGEAGVDIPRLAQEQGVGVRVDPGSLMPGDLAVWDGHVAMVIGNGMMVEAGDPVQISPIRTTNAGQGFHGFFRPTS